MPRTIELTKKEEKFIRQNYLKMSGKKIAKELGFSSCFVRRYLRRKGLLVPKEIIEKFRTSGMTGKTNFSKAEDRKIQREFLKKPIKRLADEMNRSFTGIMGRIKALGLVLPEEIRQERKLKGCFQPGQVPPNKGKKMPVEVYNALKNTMFKKGRKPYNTAYDGEIRIRTDHEQRNGLPYKWIRISEGNWEMLHRVNWEKKYGPIPPDKILVFRDTNPMNCEPDNLEMITRAENMLRNSSSLNLPDAYVAYCIVGKNNTHLLEEVMKDKKLIEIKRQQLLLRRKIKAYDTSTNQREASKHERE